MAPTPTMASGTYAHLTTTSPTPSTRRSWQVAAATKAAAVNNNTVATTPHAIAAVATSCESTESAIEVMTIAASNAAAPASTIRTTSTQRMSAAMPRQRLERSIPDIRQFPGVAGAWIGRSAFVISPRHQDVGCDDGFEATLTEMSYPIAATPTQFAPASSQRIPLGPPIRSLATPIVAPRNAVQVAWAGHDGKPLGSSGLSTVGSDEVGVRHGTSAPCGP